MKEKSIYWGLIFCIMWLMMYAWKFDKQRKQIEALQRVVIMQDSSINRLVNGFSKCVEHDSIIIEKLSLFRSEQLKYK